MRARYASRSSSPIIASSGIDCPACARTLNGGPKSNTSVTRPLPLWPYSASDNVSISDDAKWASWNSGATNVVAGDDNGETDVFVRVYHEQDFMGGVTASSYRFG